MSDQDEEEQPPFQWNRQATIMVMITGLAMVLPLAAVAWFANNYLQSRQSITPSVTVAARPSVDTASLERGLERMSDEQFASAVMVDNKKALELAVAPEDMQTRIARILEIAKEAGGSGLEMSESRSEVRRLMIQVPASRHELLQRAIRGDQIDFKAIPAGQATQLLEVDLKAP